MNSNMIHMPKIMLKVNNNKNSNIRIHRPGLINNMVTISNNMEVAMKQVLVIQWIGDLFYFNNNIGIWLYI